jgi:hypothetical protein
LGEKSNALLTITVAAFITFAALPACAETDLPADAAPPVSPVVSEPAPQSVSGSPPNLLYAVYGQGRESPGLSYALDVAAASTERQLRNGSRVAGALGPPRDFWSAGVKPDRSGLNFRPANGLLDRDLPDTRGATTFLSYYKDAGPGPIREIKGDMSLTARNPEDGRQQRLTSYTGGSIESRAQVRAGVWYTDTPYRPVGATPAAWSDTLNHDRYWTGAVDFNTRSSRFAYGAWGSSGSLGGGDYAYLTSYAWARPTATTFVMGTSAHASNFGTSTQAMVSAGWDFTRRQSIVGRYMNASYGKAYQLAYSQHVRQNVDLFLAYDRQPAQLAAPSAKIVITLQ